MCGVIWSAAIQVKVNAMKRWIYLKRLRFALFMAAMGVAGCAGFRGGWESLPYVGATAPTALPDAVRGTAVRLPLELPGLKLEVALDNRLRTYDTQVYLFALPLSVDLTNELHRSNDPKKTRLRVYVTASEPDFQFRPAEAVLHVGTRQFAGSAGYEWGQYDKEGQRVSKGGTWQHQPTGPVFALTDPGRKYYLAIDFDTLPPSPELPDIAIDLSRALISPKYPAIPLIRFAPVRWKEGYT